LAIHSQPEEILDIASWTSTRATRLSRDIAIHLLGGLQYMENCISLVRWVTPHSCPHAIARLQTAASLATPPHGGSLEQLPKGRQNFGWEINDIHYSKSAAHHLYTTVLAGDSVLVRSLKTLVDRYADASQLVRNPHQCRRPFCPSLQVGGL